ncbi:MAG TPA: MBL fold metallo-hydrolase [Syntrophobacteraceae bacterium]|nr:MBL fold metallo-hydrolase [Syntrophobacteraceae bacterium]
MSMNIGNNLHAYPWETYTENNCNSYFIDGPVRTLIDPGHLYLMPNLESRMRPDGFSLEDVQLVIATHPHPDHCEGLAAFAELKAKTTMHVEAESFLKEFSRHWEQLTGKAVPAVSVDFFLRQGELRLGEEVLHVIETPGHAPGSICLYWEDRKVLFSGDVIFAQGMGRTDFPGGDPLLLARSIQGLMDLDVELLLPGHGPGISGRGAVKENFYRVLSMFQQMF